MAIAGAVAVGVGGAAVGSYYANKSASSERGAYGTAANDIRAGKSEALNYQQPYSDFGQQALSPLSALLFGKNYDSKSGNFSDISSDDRMSNFLQSPGYQFRLSEGLRAIEKSQAARGGLLSGGAMKELGTYSQGLASDEYGNYLKSLFDAAGIGQTASSNQSNIATGAANNLANTSLGAGMANANKYSNLSNFAYGIGGLGALSALSPNANNTANTGRYNSSYGNTSNSSAGNFQLTNPLGG